MLGMGCAVLVSYRDRRRKLMPALCSSCGPQYGSASESSSTSSHLNCNGNSNGNGCPQSSSQNQDSASLSKHARWHINEGGKPKSSIHDRHVCQQSCYKKILAAPTRAIYCYNGHCHQLYTSHGIVNETHAKRSPIGGQLGRSERNNLSNVECIRDKDSNIDKKIYKNNLDDLTDVNINSKSDLENESDVEINTVTQDEATSKLLCNPEAVQRDLEYTNGKINHREDLIDKGSRPRGLYKCPSICSNVTEITVLDSDSELGLEHSAFMQNCYTEGAFIATISDCNSSTSQQSTPRRRTHRKKMCNCAELYTPTRRQLRSHRYPHNSYNLRKPVMRCGIKGAQSKPLKDFTISQERTKSEKVNPDEGKDKPMNEDGLERTEVEINADLSNKVLISDETNEKSANVVESTEISLENQSPKNSLTNNISESKPIVSDDISLVNKNPDNNSNHSNKQYQKISSVEEDKDFEETQNIKTNKKYAKSQVDDENDEFCCLIQNSDSDDASEEELCVSSTMIEHHSQNTPKPTGFFSKLKNREPVIKNKNILPMLRLGNDKNNTNFKVLNDECEETEQTIIKPSSENIEMNYESEDSNLSKSVEIPIKEQKVIPLSSLKSDSDSNEDKKPDKDDPNEKPLSVRPKCLVKPSTVLSKKSSKS